MSDPLQGASSTPTVLRMILGTRLRELREERGISFVDAAKVLGVTQLTVRRMENAQVGLKPLYVRELLRLYEVSEAEIEEFMEMADKATKPGWWHPYRDALPDWFRAYVSLETAAQVIRVYEPHYITGLLQTRDYAREVIRAGFPHEPADRLEHRVDLRMRRQGLLDRENAPLLWVVMEESVLRRCVGGPEVMKAQLDRLLEAVEHENVTFRVVPWTAGAHPAAGAHMTYFRFAERELQDIVYTEVGLTSSTYFDQREDVVTHLEAHTRVSRLASERLPDPRAYLKQLREELDR